MPLEHRAAVRLVRCGNEKLGEIAAHDYWLLGNVDRGRWSVSEARDGRGPKADSRDLIRRRLDSGRLRRPKRQQALARPTLAMRMRPGSQSG